MKVAVIGNGNVGMAVFREMMNVSKVSELVLIGRNKSKLYGEIRDYLDAEPLRFGSYPRLTYGGYDKTKGADIIIYTAGSTKVVNGDRNELISTNVVIAKEIFTEVNKYNKDSIIIVITNPLDIIVKAICSFTGRPIEKVIGTGNMLESSRLIARIATIADVSPKSVTAVSVGEHGNSSVVLQSQCTIYGRRVSELAEEAMGDDFVITPDILEQAIRISGFKIYEVKGSTSYAVAACAAKLVQAILDDSREILCVSTVLDGEYDVNNIAISVPCIIGRNGRAGIHMIKMNDDEWERFRKSVDTVEENCRIAGLI